MDRTDVLAVVVTYRAPDNLAACLSSLSGQCRTYIVDNSDDNRLYTRGVNTGIKEAQRLGLYNYVLVTCDDVTLRPGAVSALAEFLDTEEKCAIASPVQVTKTGEVTCGGCTVSFPYGKHIMEPLTHDLYKKGPYPQYWANGACFLLRLSAAQEFGLMDENMQFICSDADYSYTARSRGWEVFMVPAAIVQHEPDRALKVSNKFLERTKDQDCVYFIRKWLCGGLFQGLAVEGPELSSQTISEHFRLLNWKLAHNYPEEVP